MAATEPFCRSIGINPANLSHEEYCILESTLFTDLYQALKTFFQTEKLYYLSDFNPITGVDQDMLESDFSCLMIRDILATEEYTLQGIATYTQTHEDIVHDIVLGRANPTAIFFRRIIELHRTVRPGLYAALLKKIAEEQLGYPAKT